MGDREAFRSKANVPSATIAFGCNYLDEARVPKHLHMVRQEIRADAELVRELARRAVADRDSIDDGEAVCVC